MLRVRLTEVLTKQSREPKKKRDDRASSTCLAFLTEPLRLCDITDRWVFYLSQSAWVLLCVPEACKVTDSDLLPIAVCTVQPNFLRLFIMNVRKAAAWATSVAAFFVFIYAPDKQRLSRQTAVLSFPDTPAASSPKKPTGSS